jgi:hypothetical protein
VAWFSCALCRKGEQSNHQPGWSKGNDVYLEPDEYSDDEADDGGGGRGVASRARTHTGSSRGGVVDSVDGDGYAGKLTRGKSGLRDKSTKVCRLHMMREP